jgi:hypothetical protein
MPSGLCAHLVVVEGNIQAPVQAIFHRPVGANRSSDPFRIGV